MSHPVLVSRSKVADTVPVKCGIGHLVRTDVYDAVYRYHDMDGELMAPFTVQEYDPDTCIVCGLKIWHRVSDV